LGKDIYPILTIDVWEHAYYVDYKNLRADYLKNIWRIVNWAKVSKRLDEVYRQPFEIKDTTTPVQ